MHFKNSSDKRSGYKILNILINDLKNVKIVNIYNEKTKIRTVKQKPLTVYLNIIVDKSILTCEDFNAHHEWWNFKIFKPIRAQNIIKWTTSNKLSLTNVHDEIT